MNADHEMTHEEIIRTRLEVMRRQHRELPVAHRVDRALGPQPSREPERRHPQGGSVSREGGVGWGRGVGVLDAHTDT